LRLRSVVLARTIWLFDLTEFNPKGLNIWPVAEWLAEKYRFAGIPKNILDLNEEKALAFRFGSFLNSRNDNIVVSLTVYNNGFAAEASTSTDDSDEFVQTVAAEVADNFNLHIPKKIRRAHVSQLDFESDFSLEAFSPKLAAFTRELTNAVKSRDQETQSYDFGVLQLWTPDPNPATAPAFFRFERKLGTQFSDKRYFSQAALVTKEHIRFVEMLEKIASE
jgi:hypothetical protein